MKWAVIVSEYQSGDQPMGILVDIEDGGSSEALRLAMEFVKKDTRWNVRSTIVYPLNWVVKPDVEQKKKEKLSR